MTNTGTFYQQAVRSGTKIFATAPMIDWSDVCKFRRNIK